MLFSVDMVIEWGGFTPEGEPQLMVQRELLARGKRCSPGLQECEACVFVSWAAVGSNLITDSCSTRNHGATNFLFTHL